MDKGPYSACCGAPMSGLMVDLGMCPECKDHCDIEREETEETKKEE